MAHLAGSVGTHKNRGKKVQKESCLLKKPTDLLPSIFDRVIAREITRVRDSNIRTLMEIV